MSRIVILLLIWIGVGNIFVIADTTSAMQHTTPLKDSVLLSDPLPVQDSVFFFQRDTFLPTVLAPIETYEKQAMVYFPDSLILDSLRYEYTKIKGFAYKRKLTKELYKMIFINPRPNRVNVMRTQNSEERFEQFRGKIIRDISIKVLPPYGSGIYDTTYHESDLGWLKDAANKTHLTTAESVLRKQLTIKPGIELRPFELVQNEILMRRLDYIDDATMMVSMNSIDTNQVDICIICKDELSWGGKVESDLLSSFELGVENKNFLRLGHVVSYEFDFDNDKDKQWGNKLEYKVNSLWGTYINVTGFYQNDHREKKVLFKLERPFLTNQMKWAGGIEAGRVYYSQKVPDRDLSRLRTLFDYHFHDIWFGRSFHLPIRYRYNQNMYVTSRYYNTTFKNRPIVNDDLNHFYYDRSNYLSAFTYAKIKYYKANLIYDFGRTEDIPSGLYLNMTSGFEKSEYENFGYLGSELRYSYFNEFIERYYEFRVEVGSYVGENGFERGLLKLAGNHISSLYSLGSLKYRYYSSVRYAKSFRSYPTDYLYLEETDIKDFTSDTIKGDQKISISLSSTFFLPYIKKGFRSSVSVYLDAGMLSSEGNALLKSTAYCGMGLGLNLRNDNLIIKNLSLSFTFYPVVPTDSRSIKAAMSSSRRGRFYDYRAKRPEMIQPEW